MYEARYHPPLRQGSPDDHSRQDRCTYSQLCVMRAWQGCESEQDQALAGMFPHGDRLLFFRNGVCQVIRDFFDMPLLVRSVFLPRRGYCLLRSLRYPGLCLFLSACGYDS